MNLSNEKDVQSLTDKLNLYMKKLENLKKTFDTALDREIDCEIIELLQGSYVEDCEVFFKGMNALLAEYAVA